MGIGTNHRCKLGNDLGVIFGDAGEKIEVMVQS